MMDLLQVCIHTLYTRACTRIHQLNSQTHMFVHTCTHKRNYIFFSNAQKMHNTNAQNKTLQRVQTYPRTHTHTHIHTRTHNYDH